MGQSVSHQIIDNGHTTSGKKIILVILCAGFIYNNSECVHNLWTGNDQLDIMVNNQLSKCNQYILDLMLENPKYNVLSFERDLNKFYLTLGKIDDDVFGMKDSLYIRQLIEKHNSDSNSLILLKEVDAFDSIFYDDCGDLKLGFVIESFTYI